MKNFLYFTSLVSILGIFFVSCSSNEQDNISVSNSETMNTLLKYGNIHNSGLDFIKSDAETNSYDYSKSRLDSVFCEWVSSQYGNKEAKQYLLELSSTKDQLINGNVLTLNNTRSNEEGILLENVNSTALKALTECITKISNHLAQYDNDKIFDNSRLLNELHSIIKDTHSVYTHICSSDIDAKAVDETLGVLYGSIEYWSNSSNVHAWSKIRLAEENNNSLAKVQKKEKSKNPSEEKEEKEEKLSKAEFIGVVGGADGIGALIGGPAAVIASAVAALSFDVE